MSLMEGIIMRYGIFIIAALFFMLLMGVPIWGEGVWQSPWFPMSFMTGSFLNDGYFLDSHEGWVIGRWYNGDGFIAHTDGDGWEAQYLAAQFRPEAIQFLTDTKGWVAGWNRTDDETLEGVMLYTEDGGREWSERHQFPWEILHMQFVTELEGWATGYGVEADGTVIGVILATTDGGESWILQYKGSNEVLDDGLCFADANNGWALGMKMMEFGNVLLRTTDGGKTWTHLPVEHLNLGVRWIAAMDFVSAEKGWIVLQGLTEEDERMLWFSVNWSILHTQDGGQTWIEQKTGTRDHWAWPSNAMYFVNEDEGWVVVVGTILHTEDGGNSWTAQEHRIVDADRGSEINLYAKALHFLDSQQGWIIPTHGGILKTDNGGRTWIQKYQMPFGDGHVSEAVFVTAEEGWVVGDPGAIFRTTDGGLTWEMQESSTSAELLGAYFVTDQKGWVVGDEGTILHTIDGGNTWMKQKSGTQFRLNDVQFVDEQEGWVVGSQIFPELETWKRIVLHTVDGGRNWKEAGNLPEELGWLRNVQFVDAKTGWIVGMGTILRTDDDGRSWQEQHCMETGTFRDVFFLDASTGWAVSDHRFINGAGESSAVIVQTVDGGVNWEVQYDYRGDRSNAPYLTGIFFANRYEGWAFGTGLGDSVILHTTDGGQTWEPQPIDGPSACVPESVCYGGSGTLWAVGGWGGLLKYTDPGLYAIPPTHWAVEPSGKGIASWGHAKQGEQSTETSSPALANGLLQNYPNPFNADTWIPYQLAVGSKADIIIYNATGQVVRELSLGQRKAGYHTIHWDGRDDRGQPVASGIYFYTLATEDGKFSHTKKMVLLK